MLLSTANHLGSTGPKLSLGDIIEISDDEDETKAFCEPLSSGNSRLHTLHGNNFCEKVEPVSKLPNGQKAILLKKPSTMPVPDNPACDGKHSLHPAKADIVVGRIADDNNSRSPCYPKQRVYLHSLNGTGPSSAPKLEKSPVDLTSSGIALLRAEMIPASDASEAGRGSLLANLARKNPSIKEESANKTDLKESPGQGSTVTGGGSPTPKKFLKPPSPKVALSRQAFLQMLLEDVDDLITKHGPHLIRNVTVKDIAAKGIIEMRPPKNLKVTPQLYKKRQFMEPISADDEVIVISDDETVSDNTGLKVETDSFSENARHSIESDYQAKENFMANLQLFRQIKVKKPMKKDIANVLKTRNNMKAYIANPHVSIVKANCIYKYVTNKGILSPEQFRAHREPTRRKRKAAGKFSQPKRAASKNNQRTIPRPFQHETPALGFRRSLRKRAVRIANQPQRFSRRFFTAALKEEISRLELNHVWTAYSSPDVTRNLNVPVIVLERLEFPCPTSSYTASNRPVLRAARPKEYKCKWCPFHCLNTPSLREHCFEFHGRIFPLVMS